MWLGNRRRPTTPAVRVLHGSETPNVTRNTLSKRKAQPVGPVESSQKAEKILEFDLILHLPLYIRSPYVHHSKQGQFSFAYIISTRLLYAPNGRVQCALCWYGMSTTPRRVTLTQPRVYCTPPLGSYTRRKLPSCHFPTAILSILVGVHSGYALTTPAPQLRCRVHKTIWFLHGFLAVTQSLFYMLVACVLPLVHDIPFSFNKL